ncbi:hypothetical protein EJ110_NYTH28966 [Nymphaea thermarum]|nr:hypothetical protein EJ110_NYTH28966 [Nymphaea thermarum]
MSNNRTNSLPHNGDEFYRHTLLCHLTGLKPSACISRLSTMLTTLNHKVRRLCSRFQCLHRKKAKTKIVIKRLNRDDVVAEKLSAELEAVRVNEQLRVPAAARIIRVATFNVALFSMAPAAPKEHNHGKEIARGGGGGSWRQSVESGVSGMYAGDRPKGILKQNLPVNSVKNSAEHRAKQQKVGRTKLRVSINLPDNEISMERSRQLNSPGRQDELTTRAISMDHNRHRDGKAPLLSSYSFPSHRTSSNRENFKTDRTIMEILKEVDADLLALQDVKAQEEKGMKPLSELAEALGMKYVFAESWAPDYGNAVLSKWPIKRWQVQKIFDDTDIRNVLKVVVDIPSTGEINFHCTHLDHLDENWRMKQVKATVEADDSPHLLAGCLNSLDETDYSEERWTDMVKYYEEIGKPTPKAEVMKFLKARKYVDAKNFAGECESVVVLAKGQDVQGTCKYGTRVDYILASPNSPYKFVPRSYTVVSSKGTSDHHLVKVDIQIADAPEGASRRHSSRPRMVKMRTPSSRGIWRTES